MFSDKWNFLYESSRLLNFLRLSETLKTIFVQKNKLTEFDGLGLVDYAQIAIKYRF